MLFLQSNTPTFGVTRCWVLGALVLGFLPSLCRGFLIMHWQASPLERLKSLRILLGLLGPRWRGTVVLVRPGIPFSSFFFYNDQVASTQIGIHNATLKRSVLSFSSLPWSITGMPLTQDQAGTAMGHDTLFHGETLFVVPATDSNHVTLPFFTQSASSNFCGPTLLLKGTEFEFIIYFNEFLAAGGWERDVWLHPEAAGRLQGSKRSGPCCLLIVIQKFRREKNQSSCSEYFLCSSQVF